MYNESSKSVALQERSIIQNILTKITVGKVYLFYLFI